VPAPAAPGAPVVPFHCRVVDYGDDLARYDSGDGGTSYRSGDAPLPLKLEHGPDVDGDGDTEDDHVACLEFSLSQTLSPPPWPASGYLPGVMNGTWYGGITWYEANTPLGAHGITAEHYVNPNHEGPFFDRRAEDFALQGSTYTANPAAAHRQFAVFVWKKEDFQNGGDRWPVSFDDQSRMVVYIARYWHGFDDGRFVVQDAAGAGPGATPFYVSEETFDVPEWVIGTKWNNGKPYVCRPAATRWARYEPAGYRIDFDPDAATFEEHEFRDVRAVGWYLGKRDLDTEQTHVKWYAFEVDAVVHRPRRPSESMAMVEVPAGQAGPVPAFYMGACEVPYSLWKQVYRCATSPFYAMEPNYLFLKDGDMGSMDLGDLQHGQDEPVTDVTWLDALAFCNALSEMEGRTPCYYTDPAMEEVFRFQEISTRATWPRGREAGENPDYEPIEAPEIHVRWEADGYRLPTEAEWTAAAGAESGLHDADSAWTSANSGGTTHPVGSGAPDALGLYDMIGNAWELVWTARGAHDAGRADPLTALGGGFNWSPQQGRVAAAPAIPYGDEHCDGNYDVGFRVVRREPGLPDPAVTPALPAPEVPSWPFAPGERGRPPFAVPVPQLALEMVEVPEGSYVRPDDRATISLSSFRMGRTEVTYSQWRQVRDWALANGYVFASDGDMGSMYWYDHPHGPDEPVTDITWHDMMVWCNALSELEGRTPLYYVDVARMAVYRAAFAFRPIKINGEQLGKSMHTKDEYSKYLRVNGPEPWVFVRWDADGYRLPTLAEWQYAASAGTSWAAGELDDYAWTRAGAGGRTHPVGRKAPNPFGLYDIIGNVYERLWSVADDAKDYYYDTRNPNGDWYDYDALGRPADVRSHVRAKRGPYAAGGSWFRGGMGATNFIPSVGYPDVGFRVVRCEAGTHPRDGVETQQRVALDVDPQALDMLQGRIWRANVMRNGVFEAPGLPRLRGEKWRFQADGPVRSSPVAVDGAVYVGSDDGRFYAVAAADGAPLWELEVPGGVESSACVAGGVVYFHGNDSRLYAVDARSGELRWKFSCPDAGTATKSSPVVGYGIVFVNLGRRGVIGVDARTGEQAWRCREAMAPAGLGSPALAEGLLIQGGSGVSTAYAASVRTERVQWQGRVPGYTTGTTAAVSDGLAFVGTSSNEPGVGAFELADGRRRWGAQVEAHLSKEQKRTIYCSPAVWEGRLYVGCDSGYLYVLDALRGTPLWDFQTGGAVRSSPAVADGVVYFGSNDGHLYALDARTGEEKWRFSTGGPVGSSPWVGEGVVYVGSDDGCLYALH